MNLGKDGRVALAMALVAWLALLALGQWQELGQRVEYPLLDWSLRQLAARLPSDPDVVLLDIDEASLDKMAPDFGRYPWTRAVHASLVDGLARQKPAAIVFDILFVDPDKEHGQDDVYFIRSAQRAKNVFLPMARLDPRADGEGVLLREIPGLEREPGANDNTRAALLLPMPGLTATGRLGAINIKEDADAIIRRYPIYHTVNGWRIPSLPVRVAKQLGYTIPDDENLPLVWHGPYGAYRTVPFHQVYFDLERKQPQRPPHEFTNKIVIIGATASGLHDLKLTPMGAGFPGPEIIATAIDNLKNGERWRASAPWTGSALTAVLLLALAFAFARGVSPLFIGLGMLGVSLLFASGAWWFLLRQRYAVPAIGPLIVGWLYYIALALRAYLLERRNRQRVTQLFGRFLDPRVVKDLVAHGDGATATTGQKREITVLFSDIRGFTTLSEQKSPQEVVELLNRYFSLQVDVIFRHQGTLDKYIGDAIMAFWGAPTDQPDHAKRALAAARDMEQTLLRFKEELGSAGKDFDVGIGMNSGEAIVGFIGSPAHRQDYTVIGDTVNTASRIEGATKGRARILVSDAMRIAIGAGVEFRDHGLVALKGKEDKVRLYEPL